MAKFAKGNKAAVGHGRPKTDQEWKNWCGQFVEDQRDHIKARALENDDFLRFIIEQRYGKAQQKIDHTNKGQPFAEASPAEMRKVAEEILDNLKFAEGRESILPEELQ